MLYVAGAVFLTPLVLAALGFGTIAAASWDDEDERHS
jgi:hypothetical protein